jgi:hypothetical protein
VGGVPVFLAGQCPGQLDAHGVGLRTLGQPVADDDNIAPTNKGMMVSTGISYPSAAI